MSVAGIAGAARESRRMHVLMVSDVYFPRINGVSTSIQTFRTALARLGVRVTVVAPDYPGTDREAGADIPDKLKRIRGPNLPRLG